MDYYAYINHQNKIKKYFKATMSKSKLEGPTELASV